MILYIFCLQAQRQLVIEALLKSNKVVKVKNLDLPDIAKRTQGYTASDLESIVRRAVHSFYKRNNYARGMYIKTPDHLESIKIKYDDMTV